MSGLVVLDQKGSAETEIAVFDFSSIFTTGQTITSLACTCSVWTGMDPNPSLVVAGGNNIQGLLANQNLAGGVVGTVYKLVMAATASDFQVRTLTAYLAIVDDPL